MIAILNYGLGNLGSIANMLKVIGEKSKITSSNDEINAADGLILPGVGAFDAGMQKLNETGLAQVVKDFAATGRPILGICLGMQMLFETSFGSPSVTRLTSSITFWAIFTVPENSATSV